MFKAMTIGASAGGVEVLHQVLPQLPTDLAYPVFIVQHRKDCGINYLCQTLEHACHLPVIEAEDKMETQPGHIYLAPPDYHLLIESPEMLALSMDAPIHCCRPAVDLLFSSASEVYGENLIGVIFSGMGRDGAAGLHHIDQTGGVSMIQSPLTTQYPSMPKAAHKAVPNATIFAPFDFYRTITRLEIKQSHQGDQAS